jgi:hypothetical protein
MEVGRLGGEEVGRLGGMEVGRHGGEEVGRLGGMEVGRLGGMEVGRLGGMGETLTGAEFGGLRDSSLVSGRGVRVTPDRCNHPSTVSQLWRNRH